MRTIRRIDVIDRMVASSAAINRPTSPIAHHHFSIGAIICVGCNIFTLTNTINTDAENDAQHGSWSHFYFSHVNECDRTKCYWLWVLFNERPMKHHRQWCYAMNTNTSMTLIRQTSISKWSNISICYRFWDIIKQLRYTFISLSWKIKILHSCFNTFDFQLTIKSQFLCCRILILKIFQVQSR